MSSGAAQSPLPVASRSRGREAVTTSLREGRYFDGLIAETGDFNPFADRGWRTLARRFEQMVRPDRPLRLLDIGCGTGQSRRIYNKHTSVYAAIDLSYGALRIARGRSPGSAWIQADACALPFADATWDVLAFSSVLHHIPDYTRGLIEAFRVLRPGGHVFAFDPNLMHPAMALFRCPASPFYLSQGVSPNERPLMPAALRRAFADAGFTDVRQRCQSDIPYRAAAPRVINSCLSLYNVGDWILERTGLGRWFGTFVVTVGRKPAPDQGRRT